MHDTSGEKSAPPKVPLLTPKFVVLSTWQPKSKDRTRCFPPRLPTHAGLRFEKAIVWPQPLLSNALGLMRHFHNGCALQTEGHRLAAIKLYLDFGFLPDPADFDGLLVWQAISRELRHPQLSAFISFFSSLQQ
eukprot:GGOE01004158.1.p3 GENE.GGOE01004158.1~~GGOE01004158.1.p3  ORF type:complete len:133 (+),score=14.37 GGOE01004158.1:515-913(+)